MKNTIFICMLLITLASCTEQERAKDWGGKTTVTLPKGQKFLNVTWKESNLWYLTKPMKATDTAETYQFQEESSFGVWRGTVIIKEEK